MTKERNSIYGLALGDAIAYRTEFSTFSQAVSKYGQEELRDENQKLLVSDDTQMSLYLLNAFKQSYSPDSDFEPQYLSIINEVAQQFITWLWDPLNDRAPGNACIRSLSNLKRVLTGPADLNTVLSAGLADSKGSGTVMRSPWLGLLHANNIIPDEHFEMFCNAQSAITHQHPTALHGSYLTALLTSRLYTEDIKPGELKDFALNHISQQKPDSGWDELKASISLIDSLPEGYNYSKATDIDPSRYLGQNGTAEDVLTTAIALVDNFGEEPLEVLKRCIFTSGDSDTIGAVAGGMVGAHYSGEIWSEIEHLVEEHYVQQLEDAAAYIDYTSLHRNS